MKKLTLTAKFLITGLFCIGLSSASLAQSSFSCGTNDEMKKLFAANPQLLVDYYELLENNRQFSSNQPEAPAIYVIPIVFHVLHRYGGENITDNQIYGQINILNEDFNARNADTSIVVDEFKALIAATDIEFRLATIDPNGFCTNGIDRIYTHETVNGDNSSKLNQWPRNKYLNVWVCQSMRNGVAGFALYPIATAGQGYIYDGVMILNDYIGSTGTSNANNSRALTHEIGHYLSLAHLWGSTNDPLVACGDDGIEDTPETKGYTTCPLANYQTAAAICDPAVVENFQNFMDYSYCSYMFTHGQAASMHATLNNGTAYRNNLWTAANLLATGANAVLPPYTDLNLGARCAPIAEFNANRLAVCQGEDVQFSNHSWNAKATTFSWTFEGGTPSSSTAENPTVKFSSAGWKQVSFTAGNAVGSSTSTIEKFIYVSNTWADFAGTHSEDFEGATAYWWLTQNPGNYGAKWELVDGVGYSGTHSYALKHFPEGNFYRLAGATDALITPSYDLRYVKEATLSFRFSCATQAEVSSDILEKLTISYSSNCGGSWTALKLATPSLSPNGLIQKSSLTNAGNYGVDYAPESGGQWTLVTSSVFETPQLKSDVRFRFEYTASDYSNNIYIDDVNVNAINTSTREISDNFFSLGVYPNPVNAESDLNISFFNRGSNMSIRMLDVLGREVFFGEDNSFGEKIFNVNRKSNNLHAGFYFVIVSDGENSQTLKVIVQ